MYSRQKNVHLKCVNNTHFLPLPFLVYHSLPGDVGEEAGGAVVCFRLHIEERSY